jgi:hypothetical protein
MVLSIIFLEDKHNILLHLSMFYEYQQFFQHRICTELNTKNFNIILTHSAQSSDDAELLDIFKQHYLEKTGRTC